MITDKIAIYFKFIFNFDIIQPHYEIFISIANYLKQKLCQNRVDLHFEYYNRGLGENCKVYSINIFREDSDFQKANLKTAKNLRHIVCGAIIFRTLMNYIFFNLNVMAKFKNISSIQV